MKKELLYRSIFRRKNLLKRTLFDFVLYLASYPRLMLEVFIRKNFGERYFSLATGITIGAILAFIPVVFQKTRFFFTKRSFGNTYGGESSFWADYATWYIFIAAFAYCVYLRWKEIKRTPSVFNLGRFSVSMGDINHHFFQIALLGKKATYRQIEIYYEPGLFFLAGCFLKLLDQPLGLLLIISSVFYSISYAAAYKNGDDFVLDKIDEMILNENLHDAFVGEGSTSNTRGFRWYGDRPNSKEEREKVYEAIFHDEENATVI